MMTIRISTGMENRLLDGGSNGGVKGAFNGGFMAIFQGTQPADANTGAGSALLLGTVTNNDDGSTGIQFDAASSGVSSKAAAQTWRFHGINGGGIAGWFRIYATGDTITADSSSAPRIDGSIGTSGADLNISNTTIVAGAVTTIDSFTVTIPKV
jgi:hypothetical protein